MWGLGTYGIGASCPRVMVRRILIPGLGRKRLEGRRSVWPAVPFTGDVLRKRSRGQAAGTAVTNGAEGEMWNGEGGTVVPAAVETEKMVAAGTTSRSTPQVVGVEGRWGIQRRRLALTVSGVWGRVPLRNARGVLWQGMGKVTTLTRSRSMSAVVNTVESRGSGGGEHGRKDSGGTGYGATRAVLRGLGGLVLVGGITGGVYVYRVRQQADQFRVLWQEKHDAIDKQVKNTDGASLVELVPRGLWLFLLFLPVGLTALPAFYFESLRDWWYKMLRSTLEMSGAAFQKWGQWAATRPDIFPREMCECLAGLHAGVRAHAWEHTEEVLKKAFHTSDLSEVFAEIERTPLGSGSIAQVYRARFKGEGECVAIKVRHPLVEERLLLDFQLLNAFAKTIDLIPCVQWMGISSTLSQFGHTLGAQVRLDMEAINLQRFHANFGACPQIKTAFPLPRSDVAHASADILIESYEPGHSVASFCVAAMESVAQEEAKCEGKMLRHRSSQIESANKRGVKLVKSLSGKTPDLAGVHALVEQLDKQQREGTIASTEEAAGRVGGGGGGGGGRLKRRLSADIRMDDKDVKDLIQEGVQPLSAAEATHVVLTGKNTYLQMLLADNFMHADMHPGNILLRTHAGEMPTLVLIDAGMVDVLSAAELDNFIGVIRAMGAGDGGKAASHLLRFSAQQPHADEVGFRRYMASFFDSKCRGFGTGVVVGEVLQGVLEGLRQYRVRVDAQYATSIVNLLCIESVAAALDPRFNLLDESETLLRAHSILGREALSIAITAIAPVQAAWQTLMRWWKAPAR